MLTSARLFLCARCRCQVHICQRCDTGQQYCAGDCASLARIERHREANRRYSHTHRARVLSAQRQHRRRLRIAAQKSEKVTDQTSPAIAVRSPSQSIGPSASRSHITEPLPVSRAEVVCHFCTRVCANRVRLDFLSPSQRRRHAHRPLTDP